MCILVCVLCAVRCSVSCCSFAVLCMPSVEVGGLGPVVLSAVGYSVWVCMCVDVYAICLFIYITVWLKLVVWCTVLGACSCLS